MKHTKLESSVLHTCPIFSVEEERVKYNGEIHTYTMVNHVGAVVILPIAEDGSIYFVDQWRQAIEKRIIELPAGLLEKGEQLEDAAKRECQEEVGFLPQTLTPLFSLYSAPGFTNELLHIFIGTDLVESKMKGDPNEDITIISMQLGEALEKIARGDIVDAKTIATLYHYERICEK